MALMMSPEALEKSLRNARRNGWNAAIKAASALLQKQAAMMCACETKDKVEEIELSVLSMQPPEDF